MSISVWTVQTETQGYRQHSNKRLQHLPRDAEVQLPAASLPLSLSFLCGHPPHLLELRPSHPCPVDLTLQQASAWTHTWAPTPQAGPFSSSRAGPLLHGAYWALPCPTPLGLFRTGTGKG